jgi:hypothetical protein
LGVVRKVLVSAVDPRGDWRDRLPEAGALPRAAPRQAAAPPLDVDAIAKAAGDLPACTAS